MSLMLIHRGHEEPNQITTRKFENTGNNISETCFFHRFDICEENDWNLLIVFLSPDQIHIMALGC
jgi:hypothetical protein